MPVSFERDMCSSSAIFLWERCNAKMGQPPNGVLYM